MSTDQELAKLFASKFIARPDVFAEQFPDGAWAPRRQRLGMSDLLAHIRGERSLGHYMLNQASECKLFAFDIDLEKPSQNNPGRQVFSSSRRIF